MKKHIQDFLGEINKCLPNFLNVKPYEKSQDGEFEITLDDNKYLSRAAFELNDEFVSLVNKVGGKYFSESPCFNDNNSCFWFG